jgi:hypothetical protein
MLQGKHCLEVFSVTRLVKIHKKKTSIKIFMKGYNFFFPWCVLCREARGFLDMPKEIYSLNLREG